MAGEKSGSADVIHVCGLSAVPETIASARARHLVTCLGDGGLAQTPLGILSGRHLRLVMHDIEEPTVGYTEPSEAHVADLVDFISSWDRHDPMLIHCFAGISRSTAATFIALCCLNPQIGEDAIARHLRQASRAATPNRRLVALGDAALGRGGRMIRAAAGIGAGQIDMAAPFWVRVRVA